MEDIQTIGGLFTVNQESRRHQIAPEKYDHFPQFEEIRDRCYKPYNLAKRDWIRKCNIHGDTKECQFLINKDEIHLIDWEYGGFGDPGFDIGPYICGGSYTHENVERILFTCYRHKPAEIQRRHFYVYIAIV